MIVEFASSRVALVACHPLIIPTSASSGYPSLSFCNRTIRRLDALLQYTFLQSLTLTLFLSRLLTVSRLLRVIAAPRRKRSRLHSRQDGNVTLKRRLHRNGTVRLDAVHSGSVDQRAWR